MAKSCKGLIERSGTKKFRCGYSVKWNFNGILEVEAENAYDAERKAETKLDEMAENDEFDDVSDFKVEFDGADVLDIEEVEAKDYEDECRYAREIAALSHRELDGEAAAKTVAEAVAMCRAHPIIFTGDGLISFDYANSFGPTCTVDDVLERMNMRDWRMTCDEFCKSVLRKGGLDPQDYDWPTPLPKVMRVPEDDGTDITARVCVTFKVDGRTYEAIRGILVNEDRTREKSPDDRGEETCSDCDAQIRYKVEKGKTIVVCPECGKIQPICSECTRPEHGKGACSTCELMIKCGELENLRAEIGKEK